MNAMKWLVTAAMLAPVAVAAAPAQEVILHDFQGPEGAHPLGGVILSRVRPAGTTGPAVVGTAYSGGAHGNGVAFAITDGTFALLHSFRDTEGKFPQAGFTEASTGVLYGTLSGGDNKPGAGDNGSGAVFALELSNHVQVLHKFVGPEGREPVAPPTIDPAGGLVGTTQFGGSGNGTAGVVYKVALDGKTHVAIDFNRTRCLGPVAPVAFDASGTLHGTTWMSANAPLGCAWQWTANGTFTVVQKFTNGSTGREPRATLTPGAGGVQYGTAYYNGQSGPGTLFKLMPDGTEVVLHHFQCKDDGGYPSAPVLMDSAGVLYGTTTSCGTGGGGTLYSYDTTTSKFAVVHPFQQNNVDGFKPLGPLAMDAAGNLYGATEYGGSQDLGVVYEIKR